MTQEIGEYWHPSFPDMFVSLEYEWADNRVHMRRIHISMDHPERCPLSLNEIQGWAIDQAHAEMQERHPHPQQEFAGAWAIR